MLRRLLDTLKWIVAAFGPLGAFWILDLTIGLKAAIAGSVVFIIGDSLWRWRRGLEFSRLYLLVSGLTLVFGTIDLLSDTPFMLKYEAVITNIVTALAFVAGARGPRPIVRELAEQVEDAPYPDRPDVNRFFQLFTLVWAGYFLLKAGVYFVIGQMMAMEPAMAVRSVVGPVSMLLLMAFSFTQGERLFHLCKRLRLLPYVPQAETLEAVRLPAMPLSG